MTRRRVVHVDWEEDNVEIEIGGRLRFWLGDPHDD